MTERAMVSPSERIWTALRPAVAVMLVASGAAVLERRLPPAPGASAR